MSSFLFTLPPSSTRTTFLIQPQKQQKSRWQIRSSSNRNQTRFSYQYPTYLSKKKHMQKANTYKLNKTLVHSQGSRPHLKCSPMCPFQHFHQLHNMHPYGNCKGLAQVVINQNNTNHPNQYVHVSYDYQLIVTIK